jgi:hypothetical protein
MALRLSNGIAGGRRALLGVTIVDLVPLQGSLACPIVQIQRASSRRVAPLSLHSFPHPFELATPPSVSTDATIAVYPRILAKGSGRTSKRQPSALEIDHEFAGFLVYSDASVRCETVGGFLAGSIGLLKEFAPQLPAAIEQRALLLVEQFRDRPRIIASTSPKRGCVSTLSPRFAIGALLSGTFAPPSMHTSGASSQLNDYARDPCHQGKQSSVYTLCFFSHSDQLSERPSRS